MFEPIPIFEESKHGVKKGKTDYGGQSTKISTYMVQYNSHVSGNYRTRKDQNYPQMT